MNALSTFNTQQTWPVQHDKSLAPAPALPEGFKAHFTFDNHVLDVLECDLSTIRDDEDDFRYAGQREAYERHRAQLKNDMAIIQNAVPIVVARCLPARQSWLAERLTRLTILPSTQRDSTDSRCRDLKPAWLPLVMRVQDWFIL